MGSVARRALIHDNDVEKLKQLLSAYPALLSWRGEGDGVLGYAVNAYGDSFDPPREENFTRREANLALVRRPPLEVWASIPFYVTPQPQRQRR